jgi:hypothetical protein
LIFWQRQAGGQQLIIALVEAPLLRGAERTLSARPRLLNRELARSEQVFELFGPDLDQLLMHEGQLAQVMGIAQAVRASVVEIGHLGIAAHDQ